MIHSACRAREGMAVAMAPAQQASVPNASIDTKHEDMIVSGRPAGARCGAPPMRAGGCPPARLTGAPGRREPGRIPAHAHRVRDVGADAPAARATVAAAVGERVAGALDSRAPRRPRACPYGHRVALGAARGQAGARLSAVRASQYCPRAAGRPPARGARAPVLGHGWTAAVRRPALPDLPPSVLCCAARCAAGLLRQAASNVLVGQNNQDL